MALTEIQLKICRFHGSLSRKGSRPWPIFLGILTERTYFFQSFQKRFSLSEKTQPGDLSKCIAEIELTKLLTAVFKS